MLAVLSGARKRARACSGIYRRASACMHECKVQQGAAQGGSAGLAMMAGRPVALALVPWSLT